MYGVERPSIAVQVPVRGCITDIHSYDNENSLKEYTENVQDIQREKMSSNFLV